MKTALLISHDSITAAQLTAALPEGWSLSTCSSLNAAVHYLSSEAAPAILVELNDELRTPGCIPALRQKGSGLIAIISDAADRDLCFQVGIPDYLLKPINAAELRARLPALPRPHSAPDDQPPAAELERLASIGRLTSHICHEITNPMQAIRGAASLALEEPDVPETLKMYIDLCQHEAGRVVALVERMRKLYRPDNRRPALVDLGRAWSEAITAAWEELERSRVAVAGDLGPDLPSAMGDPDQIFLAFLGILLTVSDCLASQRGGNLSVYGDTLDGFVRFRVSMLPGLENHPNDSAYTQDAQEAMPPSTGLQLRLVETILAAHQGRIEVSPPGNPFVLQVFIPASPSG